MIVGLCGRMGAGKNEAAKAICPPFREWAFSKALRIELWRAVVNNDWPVEMPQELYADAKWLTTGQNVDELFLKPTTEPARRMLQWYGTEYRRAQDSEYWIRKTSTRIAKDDNVVLTDLRFPNEAAWVRERGGIVVKIVRGAGAEGEHSSESLVDSILPNYTIVNGGSVESLHAALKDLWEIRQVLNAAASVPTFVSRTAH